MLRNRSGVWVAVVRSVLAIACTVGATGASFGASLFVDSVACTKLDSTHWQYKWTTVFTYGTSAFGRLEMHFAHGDLTGNEGGADKAVLTGTPSNGVANGVFVNNGTSPQTGWGINVEIPDTDEPSQSQYDEIDIYRSSTALTTGGTYTFIYTIQSTRNGFSPPANIFWEAQTNVGESHGGDGTGYTFDSGTTPEPHSLPIILCGACLGAWQLRRRRR